MALGPLKQLDEGRRGRTVRALAYYPALPATPWHDPACFPWLQRLQASRGMILKELEAAMAIDEDGGGCNPWVGNDW